ncbi:hypothetical protein [Tabrizicola thermarum]|uniref:hypothetical protein n=1 Tax=Tabrizicola thermarum TaxID=2670345 RepID=UPI000FFBEB1E|nr:hypothetical protein [Tabrizicola thermarum]
MILHVLFTENGIPGWIGETPHVSIVPRAAVMLEGRGAHAVLPFAGSTACAPRRRQQRRRREQF